VRLRRTRTPTNRLAREISHAAIISASLIQIGFAQAQSLKEKYELSERCGKQAAERFEKEWGTGFFDHTDGRQTTSDYEHHYNSRLHKCIYLEIRDTSKGGKPPLRMLNLLDLHEKRTIGRYSKMEGDAFLVCSVEEKRCKSEEEWRALIKPFMED
jgi:hypothetical protein